MEQNLLTSCQTESKARPAAKIFRAILHPSPNPLY